MGLMGRHGLTLDTLFNLISGFGTAKDPTTAMQFRLNLLDRAQLEQMYRSDWISRKIIDAPAEDATREWREWSGSQDQIKAIEESEKAHKLQRKMKEAVIRARLYGGAALVFGVKGQPPETELDLERVKQGDLEFVVVFNRYELTAPGQRIYDVASPYYMMPEYYMVATPTSGFSEAERTQIGSDRSRQVVPAAGTVQVHPSRVVTFSGNELPDWRLFQMGGIWGDSVLQGVDDVLRDIGLVIGGIANMVNDAKVDVIKIPDFSKQIATTEYANRVLARFSFANQSKSMVYSLLLDTQEEWERVMTRFQGLPDVLHEYLVIAGGAADIPMSRLIGQTSGRGMGRSQSSTGGDMSAGVDLRNYYDRIASKQNTVYSPAMALLDEVIERSAIGRNDEAVDYEWKPLWQMDEKSKADIAQVKAMTVKSEVEMGLINEDVLRQAHINTLINDDTYAGLEDAIDEYGAEPEEPDIEVPWSRLAGAMAAMAAPPGLPGQPPGKPGLPPGKPPPSAPGQEPDDLPKMMKRLGVEAKYPGVRLTSTQKERKP